MKTLLHFLPEPTSDGLVAIGNDLSVETLLAMYNIGVFPWPLEEFLPIPWFSPPTRCVLFVEELHISQSLKKFIRRTRYIKTPWKFFVNRDCPRVIEECARSANRTGQRGTWITTEMKEAYTAMHAAGHCQSLECYEGDELIAGVYGISLKHIFAAESMFYKRPNASKCCLVALAGYLMSRDIHVIDCQVSTPNSLHLGAREIPAPDYRQLLNTPVQQECGSNIAWPHCLEVPLLRQKQLSPIRDNTNLSLR